MREMTFLTRLRKNRLWRVNQHVLFWLIPVVVILVIVGAILVSKWIRRSANDDSLFDDDQDEARADDGF